MELQEKLSLATAAGGPLTADGDFGPSTRRRILAFRRANALGTSPVADAGLWTALDAAVAALPAPVRPALSLGATGADVALAQQKLNAVAGAGAALPIDGIFSPIMIALVIAFQIGRGISPTGTINAETWRALDRAAPGGGLRSEGGTNVEQHVVNPAGASPLGRPIAGTGLHAPVGPGGITRGIAVKEFQQKLNIWRRAQGQAVIGDDGRWGRDTRTATLAFQGATPGLAASGIGDLATWRALDAVAPIASVGFQERQWSEEVGGHTYRMTNAGRGGSRYSWEIKTGEILVSAKVNFTGAAPPSAWFGHVSRTWNRYKAVREGTNESLNINFRMVRGSGPDSRSVSVVAPPATGRANAGTWYAADRNAARSVPHEFGHLIGLRDEYQLHPGDFREITGREPDVGATAGPAGVTPLQIAQNLRAAMLVRNSANALAAVAGVSAGAFAQQIVAQYATLGAATVPAVVGPPAQPAVALGTNLARDLDQSLPNDADRYATIQVLTYTSGSLMGDPGRAPDPHDHGVQPRHVQEFVDVVAAARGGRWRAELR
jgi:peptidoglycan hydrolase-like protein with peptidoglycan-binding domain